MSKSTVNGRLKSVPQRKLFSCDIALNSDASGNEPQGEEENDDYSTLPGSVCQSSNCDDSEICMAQSVKEKGEGNEHACFECMVELQACLPDGKRKDMLTMKQDKQE